ncbi:MAG: NAD(P)-dependent glycerol-3-phosphate dehydrogenase [Gammaproteobacteria bacterium]|nr:NAD(P)-dependent glycerol-3-phosphate dehydrogenase [Gammaproteobacteria bacterium]
MSKQLANISVLGAGSWGTALAMLFSRNGHPVTLWGRNIDKIKKMQLEGKNQEFLPDRQFPENLQCESSLEAAISFSDILVIAVPSHSFRTLLQTIKGFKPDIKKLAWATKGFEIETQKLLHQVAIEEFNDSIELAIISGPTFALEVADGLPTAVTIASNQQRFAKELAQVSHNDSFRPYMSDDIVGLEVGGAVKNVLAIAAGIADGLGFGSNTRTALITRGIAEMTRFAVALGGKPTTLMGLSGIGDLMLTCTDNQSRNRRLGLAIGSGKNIQQAMEEIKQVVEGYEAAKAVHLLSHTLKVKMPIVEQVYSVLYQNKQPKDAVKSLLNRDFNYEH